MPEDPLVGQHVPSVAQIDAIRAQRSFQTYVELIAPAYRFSRFHVALADILTKFAHGEIPNLIIQAPPQHGKSELFSRLLPGYLFALHRGIDIMATSYGDKLVRKNARAARRYMETEAYRRMFPGVVAAETRSKKVSTSNEFETAEGSYLSAPIQGGLTGNGGSFILIDDPLKNREEADSKVIRDKVWDQYTSSILTRWRREITYQGRQIKGGIGLTLTRWHDDDLAGHLLESAAADPEADQWTVFNFPAIYEG